MRKDGRTSSGMEKHDASAKTFDRLYGLLNPDQKKAVDAIEGPVTVIAGPGTGKTHILTLRIANILRRTDTTPDGILALTFTESAVYSMRKRLVEIIGPAAYRVRIHTFHGFCNEVIRRYPEAFDRIVGASNISEIDQIKIMERIVRETPLALLKPFGDPFYYVRPVLDSIRDLKREDYAPQDLAHFLTEEENIFAAISDLYHEKGRYKGKMKGVYADALKKIERTKELFTLYEHYEQILKNERLYDYEDMILETVRVLERDEDLLLRLEEQYLYILADEHQDANRAQNRLLELLSSFHEQPNLFVVGDGKQAIFRFQGASLDNFLYFKKRYPDAFVVNLCENYRSSQHILDGAHSLIAKSAGFDERFGVPLIAAQRERGERLEVRAFQNEEAELRFIADHIASAIGAGMDPREIAVLYRNNSDVLPFLEVLERRGIPYAVFSDQDLLADEDIRKLVLLMRAVLDLGNNELLSEVLFLDFFALPLVDVYKALQVRSQLRRMLFECIGSRAILTRAGVDDAEKFLLLARKLASWGLIVRNKNAADAAEILIRESGFLASLLSKDASAELLHKLDGFFREIKTLAANHPGARLADVVATVDLYRTHKLPLHVRGGGAFISGVQLMTAHRSKGLEFEQVYIFHAVDGHWGNQRKSGHFRLPTREGSKETGDDERRLFYVALTRAKKRVMLTYAEENASGKRSLPTQFIEEIDEPFRVAGRMEETEIEMVRRLPERFTPKRNAPVRVLDKAYLNKLFLEQGFAVTHLNNFLECPWRYFFNNLIRIQRAPSRHQYYGIAMHAALRHFFDSLLESGIVPTVETLLSIFKRETEAMPVDRKEQEACFAKGADALRGYAARYGESFITPLANEKNIAGVFFALSLDDGTERRLMLRGTIDKVESPGEGEAHVIDYKTGQPKTRNVILGNTKHSIGKEWRQLVFYKLLLDAYEPEKLQVVSGAIDFIEPDKKGMYHREQFAITDDDVAVLQGEIRAAAASILNLSFWNDRCKKRGCTHCALANMLQEHEARAVTAVNEPAAAEFLPATV